MAEMSGQQKASDACGGRLSHERGWRTRGQDAPGPINCTRRSPSSSLLHSSVRLVAIFLSLALDSFPVSEPLFSQRSLFCDRSIPDACTEPKPRLSRHSERLFHACNVHRSLFHASNVYRSLASFDLRDTVVSLMHFQDNVCT